MFLMFFFSINICCFIQETHVADHRKMSISPVFFMIFLAVFTCVVLLFRILFIKKMMMDNNYVCNVSFFVFFFIVLLILILELLKFLFVFYNKWRWSSYLNYGVFANPHIIFSLWSSHDANTATQTTVVHATT